ncbi:MAG TPA: carboxypeptidase-like regulatory domain-containing protein [Pyrinomonadaceae bacterium]|jgi:hypothetical protein
MTKQKFDVNNLRVASPCSVGWETMSGDERVRRCQSCELNVYNIAEMTRKEAENLIVNREGRVCLRLYKRADGTILTKDCPIGLRAYQKRAARLAGAAFAAILGLFSVSFGQKNDKNAVDASKVKIVRTVNQNQESILSGVILDPTGAVVPGAEIMLYRNSDKETFRITADADGNYIFKTLSAGVYTLQIREWAGFKKYKIVNLKIRNAEKIRLDIFLEPNAGSITVGIFMEDAQIDTTSNTVTTTITNRMIDTIPH